MISHSDIVSINKSTGKYQSVSHSDIVSINKPTGKYQSV